MTGVCKIITIAALYDQICIAGFAEKEQNQRIKVMYRGFLHEGVGVVALINQNRNSVNSEAIRPIIVLSVQNIRLYLFERNCLKK